MHPQLPAAKAPIIRIETWRLQQVWMAERSEIASEEKTPGKYHKEQLRTLCSCSLMLCMEMGVFKQIQPV